MSYTNDTLQEISEMIGGKISNQDEDEVEDELEAMEREVSGVVPSMPNAPTGVTASELPDVPEETPEQRARRRREERAGRAQAKVQASEPIAA